MIPNNFGWSYTSQDYLWAAEGEGQTLAGFRTSFLGWLNRGDTTPALANDFINKARQRINRELRVPEMEQTAYTALGKYTSKPADILPVPDRLMDFKQVIVDGRKASPVPFPMLRNPAWNGDRPLVARQGGIMGFFPKVRRWAEVTYYQGFARMVNDTDTTPLFDIAEDLLLYASLAYAGDFYRMTNQPAWDSAYQSILQTLNERANEIEFMGGPLAVGAVEEDTMHHEVLYMPVDDLKVILDNSDFGGDIV